MISKFSRTAAVAFMLLGSGNLRAADLPARNIPSWCSNESQCLSAFPERARREGDALILLPISGQPITLTDSPSDCEPVDSDDDETASVVCHQYALRNYSDRYRLYLIDDGENSLILDANSGEELEQSAAGKAIVSPEGDRIAVLWSNCEAFLYTVTIFTVGSQSPLQRDFKYEGGMDGEGGDHEQCATDLRWLGDNQLVYTSRFQEGADKLRHIRFASGMWSLK